MQSKSYRECASIMDYAYSLFGYHSYQPFWRAGREASYSNLNFLHQLVDYRDTQIYYS